MYNRYDYRYDGYYHRAAGQREDIPSPAKCKPQGVSIWQGGWRLRFGKAGACIWQYPVLPNVSKPHGAYIWHTYKYGNFLEVLGPVPVWYGTCICGFRDSS